MRTRTGPGQYTIRAATNDDLPSVLALLEASSLPTVGVDAILSEFLVAESHDGVVGVVGIERCRDHYALLRSTAVRDDWRGRGLGRRLVGRAIAAAATPDAIALYLLTTTAEPFFREIGFARLERSDAPAPIQETDEFRSACPASATVMMLRLKP